MSKITKKKLQADHNKLLNQFAELVRSLKSSKVISEETCPTFYRRTTEIVDDTCEQAEPKLKKLDQSVFPLIERDIAKELAEVDLSSELTGSDYYYSKSVTERLESGQELVMCFVSNVSESDAMQERHVEVITSVDTEFNDTDGYGWQYAIPINNQGEPLTATDVGL